jgi:dCTP deaminase
MLNYEQILAGLDMGNIIITPFDLSQLGPNSYDVRLGNYFVSVDWSGTEPVFSKPIYYKNGELVEIPPGETILGITNEIIGAKNGLVLQMHSRSSIRRMGVSVCMDAGIGDISYISHWTTELSCHTKHSAYLRPGNLFAQIVFHETQNSERLYQGQYRENRFPENMIPEKYRK